MDITLRILFRPLEEKLPHIYANVGVDYDERILPSITTEVLKAVVVSGTILYSAMEPPNNGQVGDTEIPLFGMSIMQRFHCIS